MLGSVGEDWGCWGGFGIIEDVEECWRGLERIGGVGEGLVVLRVLRSVGECLCAKVLKPS